MRRRAPERPNADDENLRMRASSALMRLSFMPGVVVDRLKILRSSATGAEAHEAATALYAEHGIEYPQTGPRRGPASPSAIGRTKTGESPNG